MLSKGQLVICLSYDQRQLSWWQDESGMWEGGRLSEGFKCYDSLHQNTSLPTDDIPTVQNSETVTLKSLKIHPNPSQIPTEGHCLSLKVWSSVKHPDSACGDRFGCYLQWLPPWFYSPVPSGLLWMPDKENGARTLASSRAQLGGPSQIITKLSVMPCAVRQTPDW